MKNFGASLLAFACLTAPFTGLAETPLVQRGMPEIIASEAQDRVLTLGDGTTIAYRDTGGNGEVVLLAHPFTGNLHSFVYQEAALAEAGFRAISWSRPGYAGSPWKADAEVPNHAAHTVAVMDALGIKSAHVVGIAAGGATALDMVLTHPDRVLTAVVGSSLMDIAEPDYKAAIESVRGPWFDTLPEEVKELSPSYRVTWPEGVAAWQAILDKNPPRPAQMPPRMKPDTAPTWAALAANKVPLLLVTGGADLYQPPELLRRVAERTGTARFKTVDGAGHAIFFEQPDAFNAMLLDHLSRR